MRHGAKRAAAVPPGKRCGGHFQTDSRAALLDDGLSRPPRAALHGPTHLQLRPPAELPWTAATAATPGQGWAGHRLWPCREAAAMQRGPPLEQLIEYISSWR